LLKGKTVKWFSDSQSCVHIVQCGSTKLDLHEESMNIFELCSKFNIDLQIQWVPREQNKFADEISKFRSTDEWQVTGAFFEFLDKMWGPHDIDRFATYLNRKVKRFNSKFVDFETEAVDTFTQCWGKCNNWLVPPVRLVPKTISHLLHCKGRGTIVVPKWPSSPFWPLLFKKNFVHKDFISEVLEFSEGQDIFTKTEIDRSIFDSSRFKSKVLAVRIESNNAGCFCKCKE
jgi:hypothetical protein